MNSEQAQIISRCFAAVGGGYIIASLFSITATRLMVRILQHPLGDSVLIATMLSYCVFFGVFIFCFSPCRQRLILPSISGAIVVLYSFNIYL